MSILPIHLIGDKIFEKKAKQIKKIDNEIKVLVNNMFETMRYGNGIGLAATQVGSDKSIFIVDLSPVKGFENFKPMVFINPKIIFQSEEKSISEEGCLSVPSIRAEVERPKGIKIIFRDVDNNEKILEDNDLLARVIQHEYDHLIGTFFIDRIPKDILKRFKKTLTKIKNRKLEFEYLVSAKEK